MLLLLLLSSCLFWGGCFHVDVEVWNKASAVVVAGRDVSHTGRLPPTYVSMRYPLRFSYNIIRDVPEKKLTT